MDKKSQVDNAVPWRETVDSDQPLAAEACHEAPNAVLRGRVYGRALGVDVAHDARDQYEAPVALVLMVEMPARQLRRVNDA